MTETTQTRTGIAAMGVAIPDWAMELTELATLRGVDPAKFTRGLGCETMAVCPPETTAVELAARAAERALAQWDGALDDIGLLAVGTETAEDMSRPLSAFVAEKLGLSGHVRSYEVKHACYGGTVALRQALEWRLSGAARGRAALVVATDVALYAPEHPGEPTQGAGAVAMIVADDGIARIEPASYAYSEPAFDFWRPVGEAHPRVEGKLSLDCYNKGTLACLRAWADDPQRPFGLDDVRWMAFHVPFPKMVTKAVRHAGATLGWSEDETERWFREHVDPTMAWNRQIGNSYTASLWFSVAKALADSRPGDRIAALSYGSGFGTELLLLTATDGVAQPVWAEQLETDFAARTWINNNDYEALRRGRPLQHAVNARDALAARRAARVRVYRRPKRASNG